MSKTKKIILSILVPIILLALSIFGYLASTNSKDSQIDNLATALENKYDIPDPSTEFFPLEKMPKNEVNDTDRMDAISDYLMDDYNKKQFETSVKNGTNDCYSLITSGRIYGIFPIYKLNFIPVNLTIITDVPDFKYKIGEYGFYKKAKEVEKTEYDGSKVYQLKLTIYPSDAETKITVRSSKKDKSSKEVTLNKSRKVYIPIYDK